MKSLFKCRFPRMLRLPLAILMVPAVLLSTGAAFASVGADTTPTESTVLTELRCDYRENPMGIDIEKPYLSWKIQSNVRGQKQTAYRIGVSSTEEKLKTNNFDVWDTGFVSSAQLGAVYGGKALTARTVYYWTVIIKDKDGRTVTGETATFETALFGDFGSGNHWIQDAATHTGTKAPLFRRSFETLSGKTLAKARLYATAAGTHEMYLNGQRASDDYLAPGHSEYTQILYYQTYDVTHLILAGQNTVAAQLGMGWFNGKPIGADYGENIALRAKLILTYTDGSEQVIDTDSSWLVCPNGPTTVNQFYTGQYVDGRLNIAGWNSNELSTADAAKFKAVSVTDVLACNPYAGNTSTFPDTVIGKTVTNNFVAESTEPIRVIAENPAVKATKIKAGTYVYDFGYNRAGTLRLAATASAGRTITIDYGEVLNEDGTVNTADLTVNNRKQNGMDKYTFAGKGLEEVTFSLTYHGFRYVQISGLTDAIALNNLTQLVLSTDNERTGELETSNELLNRFYKNAVSSWESNVMSTITDCPTREKNSWTGDAQGYATAASYHYNVFNIYRKFQEMITMSQDAQGRITQVVPHADMSNLPSGWSDAVVLIPWQMYYQYGDISFLADNYEAMAAWVDYLVREVTDPATVESATAAGYTSDAQCYVRMKGSYGDNMPWDTAMSGRAKYPEIGTAYSAYTAKLLAKIATLLDKTADAGKYQSISDKFACGWRTNFLEADGFTCKTTSQTSYAMGLYYDLYETPELKAKAAEKLNGIVRNGYTSANGKAMPANSMTVGFIGHPILLNALSDNGYADACYAMLEQTGQPSVLWAIVEQDATTTWEHYSNAASRNHFHVGVLTQWLYSDVLGISHGYDANNAGYRHFVLQPTPGGSLSYAKGSYDSQSGRISSAWEFAVNEDGSQSFVYSCTVPANTTATVKLPLSSQNAVVLESGKAVSYTYENGRAVFEVESGSYVFAVQGEYNTFNLPAPSVLSVTGDSVTLKAATGYEYSMGGNVWQSENTFTGLDSTKEYKFYWRKAAEPDKVSPALTLKLYKPGDVNGDWTVNGKDVVFLRQYMANYDYSTDTSPMTIGLGADANGDGVVNGKDVVLLRQYMANFDYTTNTSTVVLGKKTS